MSDIVEWVRYKKVGQGKRKSKNRRKICGDHLDRPVLTIYPNGLALFNQGAMKRIVKNEKIPKCCKLWYRESDNMVRISFTDYTGKGLMSINRIGYNSLSVSLKRFIEWTGADLLTKLAKFDLTEVCKCNNLPVFEFRLV